MNIKGILVVDDNDANRQELVSGLAHGQVGYVQGVKSGHDAVALVTESPDKFDFAIIDQALGSQLDGIETCRMITGISAEVIPIVFTNIPSDDRDTVRNYRAKAFSAGAFRYMYRGVGDQAAVQVADVLNEIGQLRDLRLRLDSFYKEIERASSLHTQLEIMVSLYDQSYRLWYCNDIARRFYLQYEGRVPTHACTTRSCNCLPPCSSCIISSTFAFGSKREGTFIYTPDSSRDIYRYLHTWSQPMLDENGLPLFGKDGKPLAVVEAAIDITDSQRIRDMPVSSRVAMAAEALTKRDGGFDRVRVYKAERLPDSADMQFRILCIKGYPDDTVKGVYQLKDNPDTKNSIEEHFLGSSGSFYYRLGHPDPIVSSDLMERFIHWPLVHGDKVKGLLSVSRNQTSQLLSSADVATLRPYAHAILDTLVGPEDNARAETYIEELSRIEVALFSGSRAPKEMVKTLLTELCSAVDVRMSHIRLRTGQSADLFPVHLGNYGAVAPSELPLSQKATPSVRVILSGRTEVENDTTQSPSESEFRATLPIDARTSLEEVHSYCFVPLVLRGSPIGSLGLFSKNVGHFTPQRVQLIEAVSDKLALIVHDYLIHYERTKDEDQRVRLEAMQVLATRAVHHMRSPASAIRAYAEHLLKQESLDPESRKIIEGIAAEANRINTLASDSSRFLTPVKHRSEIIDLREVIAGVITRQNDRMGAVHVSWVGAMGAVLIEGDRSGLIWVFEELFKNAIEASATNIEVECKLTSDYVICAVQDNGEGIKPAIREHMFEQFVSSRNGWGVGLATARQIMEEHGGDIEADSQFDKGARFVLRFPTRSPQP